MSIDIRGVADQRVFDYAEQRSTPLGGDLDELIAATHARSSSPWMMSGLAEIRLLQALVAASQAKHVVEVGTFTGVGALAIASVLPPGGRLTTFESRSENAAIAAEFFAKSPYGDKIELVVGDACEELAKFHGPIDLAYVDAEKSEYHRYYEALLPILAPSGVILCDNVLWSGSVIDPGASAAATALAEFNRFVSTDDRVVATILTVGDGISLIRKV
jgi:caffeoyl-CoA O-methyltransferase